MNVDFIRRFCLSFPQAKESLQWGETLCFKVRGKIFAMLSLDSVPPSLCLKCAPDKFEELLELEGMAPAPYLGRYKWVLLERLNSCLCQIWKISSGNLMRWLRPRRRSQSARASGKERDGPQVLPEMSPVPRWVEDSQGCLTLPLC
jgi:hypothetical protein